LSAIDILRKYRTGKKQTDNEHETAKLKHGSPPPEFGYCTPRPLRIVAMSSILCMRERVFGNRLRLL
jgi:hypothetical protein